MAEREQHHADGAVYVFYLGLAVFGYALAIVIVGLVLA